MLPLEPRVLCIIYASCQVCPRDDFPWIKSQSRGQSWQDAIFANNSLGRKQTLFVNVDKKKDGIVPIHYLKEVL